MLGSCVFGATAAIPTSEIEQIYIREVRHSFVGSADWTPTYEVWSVLVNGEELRLLNVGQRDWQLIDSNAAMESSLAARRIKEHVEEFLGIEDVEGCNRVVREEHAYPRPTAPGGAGGPGP